MASIYNTLQIRRGNESDFNNVNPILAFGEPAYAVDTNVLKIGDGTSRWQDLVTFSNADSLSALSGILTSQINTAIDNLIDGAPDVLNTLNELAAAIGDDENFAATFVASGLRYLSDLNDVSGILQSQIDVIAASYITSVFDDKNPNLGGDLCLNGYNVTCSGNINIDGGGNFTTVSATSGNIDYLQFNSSTVDYEPLLGQVSWNSDESTLDIGVTENIIQHIGQDVVYRVDNHTGGTIYKGQAVYASGVTSGGKRIRIDKFVADGAMSEIRFMGLASENINHGELGFIQHFGYVKHVDLRTTNTNINPDAETWNEGDILYVHPSTAGGLTKTQPQESIITALVLGTGNAGELFVRPTLYGHVDNLHDVSASTPSSGDGLIYNGATSLWENVTVPKSDISGITGSASGVYNIVVVDSATYTSISPKDPNTLYFVS